MKKTLIILVLLFSSSVVADNYVCISEKVTGFSYINQNWKPMNFNNILKYKIKKLPLEKCSKNDNSEDVVNHGYKFTHDCYEVKEFEDSIFDTPQLCGEIHKEDDSGKLNLVRVTCDNFIFSPDGDFIKTYVHGMVQKHQKERDSIYLAVGKCSRF